MIGKKAEIKALRARGFSYAKIADRLDVDRTYAWRVCTGREKSHPRPRLRDVPPALTDEQLSAKLGSVTVGCLSETLVAVKLTTLGFNVWKPFIERQRSDLAILCEEVFSRIQVKTASYDTKGKRFRCSLTTKDGKRRHVSYAAKDFEFFIIRCAGLDDYYILPFTIGAQYAYVNLYPNREPLLDRGHPFEQYRNAFNLLRERA